MVPPPRRGPVLYGAEPTCIAPLDPTKKFRDFRLGFRVCFTPTSLLSSLSMSVSVKAMTRLLMQPRVCLRRAERVSACTAVEVYGLGHRVDGMGYRLDGVEYRFQGIGYRCEGLGLWGAAKKLTGRGITIKKTDTVCLGFRSALNYPTCKWVEG
jgi:hypothetical protein